MFTSQRHHLSCVSSPLHLRSATGENLLKVIGLFSLSGLFGRKWTQKEFSAAENDAPYGTDQKTVAGSGIIVWPYNQLGQ